MKSFITKYKKRIIALVIIFLFILIFSLYQYYGKKVYMSSPLLTGNTASNLYNMGLYCEDNDKIYFSNPKDDGTLYSMNHDLTDVQKIYNDKIQYINADENYLYYSRINNKKEQPSESIFVFFNTGIFRIKKDGSKLKMLHNSPIGSLLNYDNKLFYQYYKEGEKLSIHSMGIDGKDDAALIEGDFIITSVLSNKLYYSATKLDHGIHSVDAKNASTKLVTDKNTYMPIAKPSGIYYISTDKYLVSKIKNDDSIEILTNKPCSTYNLTEDERYLFYQVNGTADNGIEMLEIETANVTRIKSGDFKWLNIAGNKLFFYEFNETATYVYDIDTGSLQEFNPDKIE